MRKTASILGILVGSLGVLSAGEPVATISSSGTFILRGVTVSSMGVSRWPIMAGDSFESGSSTATVQFKDGSKVAMSENSKAIVVANGDQLTFRVVSGSVQVAPASGTRIVFNQNQSSAQENNKGVTKAVTRLFPRPGPQPAPPLSNR
jgi:hypothetical protein